MAETNPTVTMAICQPRVANADTLPTRKRSVVLAGVGALKAKSDYYWNTGAGSNAALMLGQPDVAAVRHHEHVAGLWCLALARAMGGAAFDNSSVVALGDVNGIYLMPDRLDETWRNDIERVGVCWGSVAWERGNPAEPGGNVVEVLRGTGNSADILEEEDLAAEYDDGAERMTLTDNGGLHLNANAWLEGVEFPVRIRTRTTPPITATISDQTGHSAPYCIDPSALDLARAVGFVGAHLSKKNPAVVDFEFVGT